MKQFLIVFLMVFVTTSFAGVCDTWQYSNNITAYTPPLESGKYIAISPNGNYSNGKPIMKGDGFEYLNWKNNSFYNTHSIACLIIGVNYEYEGVGLYEDFHSCYLITVDCMVSEKTQFYDDDIKYTDLRGYRYDGTLKWERNRIGSTDISCYNKAGIYITKRVNNPKFCD